MAQSFQVAPEYVDEITFTTKVSSIEYRVSNQIQVSIHIGGIRYRTSTSVTHDLLLHRRSVVLVALADDQTVIDLFIILQNRNTLTAICHLPVIIMYMLTARTVRTVSLRE